jgi:membrane protease YdiL (CAAX protease family)
MTARRLEELAIALVVTFAAHALPDWVGAPVWLALRGASASVSIDWPNFYDLVCLAFGLLLALPTARRSGLRVGAIRGHVIGTLVVCAIPVVATILVYPRLPTRPFAGQRMGMWLVSPLAQDLVFVGYLYGRFREVWTGVVHPRLRVGWALVVTCVFFAAWHVPNFASIQAGYVVFQLVYVFLGLLLVGMSRQWTGSIVYATATHMAVNFIAWETS